MLQHLKTHSGTIISAAIAVHKTLGPGFLEVIYERALRLELERRRVEYESQSWIKVEYEGRMVGRHRLDMVVMKSVVVELKAVKAIEDIHLAVVLSYLRASRLPLGLIINFGEPVLRVRRVAGPNLGVSHRVTEGRKHGIF